MQNWWTILLVFNNRLYGSWNTQGIRKHQKCFYFKFFFSSLMWATSYSAWVRFLKTVSQMQDLHVTETNVIRTFFVTSLRFRKDIFICFYDAEVSNLPYNSLIYQDKALLFPKCFSWYFCLPCSNIGLQVTLLLLLFWQKIFFVLSERVLHYTWYNLCYFIQLRQFTSAF